MIIITSDRAYLLDQNNQKESSLKTSSKVVLEFLKKASEIAEIERNKAVEEGIRTGKNTIKARVKERLMIIARGVDTL